MRLDTDTALDPDTWRSLCDLPVSDGPTAPEAGAETGSAAPLGSAVTLSDDELYRLSEHVRNDGYLERHELFGAEEMERAATAVQAVVDAGWPAPFAFFFDEPWHLFARLGPLFESLLGASYRALPSLWAVAVPAADGAMGTPPRRDAARPNAINDDYYPTSLTATLALTDATPLNGCAYVVPAFLQGDYRQPKSGTVIQPQDGRAVPVPAGSVLAWTHNLVHWDGGSSSRAVTPRVAITLELQARSYLPLYSPRLDPVRLPSLHARARAIGMSVARQHARLAPDLGDDVLAVARALAELPVVLPEEAERLVREAH